MRNVLWSAVATALLVVSARPALASEELTSKQSGKVVDALIGELNGYFDPAKARIVQAVLKAQRGQFVRVHDRAALAEALSAVTLKVSGDQHMKVSVTTTSAQAAPLSEADQAVVDQRLAYGLMAARRLPANIGYLKLRYFEQGEEGAAMIDAALGLLKNTDAMIIDLRENTGGGGASDERLLGHLSRAPLVMEEIRWREPDGKLTIQQRRVSPAAGGPLYPDKPVYLLIGGQTFSAAEAFAYTLQANQRAMLVGTRTRGGGNPANRPRPSLGFGLVAFIPNGQVVHPLTGDGWEGVGVRPDVAAPPDGALTQAYRQALAAARPQISTPKSEKERADALADPAKALAADQPL